MNGLFRHLRMRLVVLALLTFGIGLLSLYIKSGNILAQDATCPPTEGMGCTLIQISPAGLSGEFYINETLVASGSSVAISVPERTNVTIKVRNIRDTEAGYGDTYIYQDTYVVVYVVEGQTLRYTAYTRKVWLKGFLKVTCPLTQVAADELVGCRPLVDGTPLTDILPGQSATFNLLPGTHSVRVELVGEHANRWSPQFREVRFTTWVGTTYHYRPIFTKRARLTVTLSQPNVVGDLYVNGTLIGTQVASAELWVDSYKSHVVEGKNFFDPGGTVWRPVKIYAYATPGQLKAVVLKLRVQSGSPTPTPTAPAGSPAYPYTGTYRNIPGSAHDIFKRGQSLGRRANVFSKIGDSETANPRFLSPFDRGDYYLGNYAYLAPVITYFQGSFSRESNAAKAGFSVQGILDPTWSDPRVCLKDETPLACEIRINNPAFVIIMVRSWSAPTYTAPLEQLVKFCIDQGVVPILSTVPYVIPPSAWAPSDEANPIVRQVANKYRIPLWDMAASTDRLPGRGTCNECAHHMSEPPDLKVAYFVEPNMQYGTNVRNLQALEALHQMILTFNLPAQ